ncbi:hypothetical protein GCM10022244_45340 [Streptomyces gulbargensis]|uniref:Uncharacterized protein n=1 Tax=Streptomyces gulbargensis TaxID=364901 RepID=A0ABP7MWI8_9ACTN
MNMQEAADRADAMLDATLGAIVPEVQWDHRTSTARGCDLTRRRAVTTIISEERRGSFLGLVERHWKKSGFRITSANPSQEMPALFATSPDGFQLALKIGYKGQAFFDVITPCVEPSDVADPVSKPNGPAHPPGRIPTPHVRSDFWSATTPAPSASG